jgi:pyrroline-5-carboxylate reductase
MIECMAKAGEAEGLSPDLAMQLAQATVAGAGALAEAADETPAELQRNVTSPNGTKQAGLDVLMDETTGLPPLMVRTVGAAAARSRALRNG